jgi:hypothetical protein
MSFNRGRGHGMNYGSSVYDDYEEEEYNEGGYYPEWAFPDTLDNEPLTAVETEPKYPDTIEFSSSRKTSNIDSMLDTNLKLKSSSSIPISTKEFVPNKDDSSLPTDTVSSRSSSAAIPISTSPSQSSLQASAPPFTPGQGYSVLFAESPPQPQGLLQQIQQQKQLESESAQPQPLPSLTLPPPGPTPTTTVPPDSWYYKDPRGQERGPFSSYQMDKWLKHNFFKVDLLIRRESETKFVPICTVFVKEQKNPFTGTPLMQWLQPPIIEFKTSLWQLIQNQHWQEQYIQFQRQQQHQLQQILTTQDYIPAEGPVFGPLRPGRDFISSKASAPVLSTSLKKTAISKYSSPSLNINPAATYNFPPGISRQVTAPALNQNSLRLSAPNPLGSSDHHDPESKPYNWNTAWSQQQHQFQTNPLSHSGTIPNPLSTSQPNLTIPASLIERSTPANSNPSGESVVNTSELSVPPEIEPQSELKTESTTKKPIDTVQPENKLSSSQKITISTPEVKSVGDSTAPKKSSFSDAKKSSDGRDSPIKSQEKNRGMRKDSDPLSSVTDTPEKEQRSPKVTSAQNLAARPQRGGSTQSPRVKVSGLDKGKPAAEIPKDEPEKPQHSKTQEPELNKSEPIKAAEPEHKKSEPIKTQEPERKKSEPIKAPEPEPKKSEPIKEPERKKSEPIKTQEPERKKSEPINAPEPDRNKSSSM